MVFLWFSYGLPEASSLAQDKTVRVLNQFGSVVTAKEADRVAWRNTMSGDGRRGQVDLPEDV